MSIKRKILTYKDFTKGKNTLENPVKHSIKESEDSIYKPGTDKSFTPREEMIKLLNQKFPNVVAKSERFKKDDVNGIWSAAENSSFVDNAKKISAFNTSGSYSYNPKLDKDYDMEVHKTLAKFLKDHGWYTEFYDDATPIFYPIHNTNESVNEKDDKFTYMMLGRLGSDCDYYLGHGNRGAKALWAGSVEAQIKEMKRLWNILTVKPEWLSMEDILDYEEKMKESND